MNDISLAKFDKPEWVVRTDKSNNYKIYNSKPRFRGGVRPENRKGCVLYAYDNGDKLNLVQTSYVFDTSGAKRFFSTKEKFYLRIKNGKLVVYLVRSVDPQKVKNVSNTLDSRATALLHPNPRKNCPVYEKRLNSVLTNFLRRNGIVFKYGKKFAQNLVYAVRPGLRGIELNSYNLHPEIGKAFGEGDVKSVVRRFFGYDNKNLVKTVCAKIEEKKSLDCLFLGKLMKNKLPVDYYYSLIEKNKFNGLSILFLNYGGTTRVKLKTIREVLGRYSPSRINKLFSADDFGSHNFVDTFILYKDAKDRGMAENRDFLPKKPKNWREIHDTINRAVRPEVVRQRVQNVLSTTPIVYENKQLPVREKYAELDGQTFEEFRFEIPKDTDCLNRYSDIMHNCIRGYGGQVIDGFVDLIGVYKNDELTYNISISQKQISQFLGKCNAAPDKNDEKRILDFLTEKGTIRKPQPTTIDQTFQFAQLA